MTEAQHTLIETSWHGDGIFRITLERNGLEFVPGDCVAIFGQDGQVSRPYSIASGIADEYLQFIIRRMPGGEVSDYLATLAPGASVTLSPPFGWFRPGDQQHEGPFVFMATGTGISPFMAYFRSYPERHPESLLYGVRQAVDAVDLDQLNQRVDVQLAVSRERVDGHHHGRITDLLNSLPVSSKHHYYLCGLDTMIDEVTVWLEGEGVPITHIHRECFFNADYE